MPELRDAVVVVGVPGLNGTGITGPEKTALTNDTTALKAATYIMQTANATTSAEQALSTLATGLLKVTTTTGVLSTAVAADLPAHNHTGVVVAASFLIDGGGAVITTGIKGDLVVPFAATITEVMMLADQAGSLTVAVWNAAFASYPPASASTLLTMTITAANKLQSTGLSIPVTAGHVLRFNVNSAATITRATCILIMTRSV